MTENVNLNLPPELSDDDAELLSAYLDNMLTATEQEVLEKRLATDAFLRNELQAMRRMVSWLNQMPDLKAPRNFTLRAEDVAQDPPPNVVLMPRRNLWLSAAVAALVIVLFGVAFVLSSVRQDTPSMSVETANDTASGAPQDEAEQVAIASSATMTATPLATVTMPSVENQAGLAAPTILGGATMSVLPTTLPPTPTAEADAAPIDTDDVREEAESSTLAQEDGTDGLLTATVVMATGQSEVMSVMAAPAETTQQAQVNDGLLTATVVMATGETFAFSATEAPDTAADTAIQAPAPMTATAIPTQALRSTGGAGDTAQPAGVVSTTGAVDTLRMTATAFVDLYEQDAEVAAESSAADTDEKQGAFNVHRFFLYLWLRLLEFIGTAP